MHEDPFGLCGATLDGRYRVDSVVGEGGFGIVYRGWHLDFDHALAIKCLKVPGHFTSAAKQVFLEKFREEGKHLSKLSSQTLASVRAFAFGLSPSRAGEVPYLVLEWLDGSDLERLLSANATAFEERDAVELLRPAVEALSCAHRMGIAHRDIKPANLYLARVLGEVQLKVLDFGIAKAMQEGETATQIATRTSSGFSAFSPRHGAPEQFSPKKLGATGPWTDVHALGLVLCEMLTGRPALDGEEPSEWLMSALAPERPTPGTRGARISDALEAICARCVALAPKERYCDAGELLAALDALFAPRRAEEKAAWTSRLPAPTPADAALDTAQYLDQLHGASPVPLHARL
ncbi:MAG: serine/threonine protein kinase [Deltaproteobacteria bacterium]|nr:serine/threonine protein kinase [Deltaproteobacteria bacterium]